VVAESTVRNHVRERKRQLGLLRRETFVPQSYSWAQEAQVDWYEAWFHPRAAREERDSCRPTPVAGVRVPGRNGGLSAACWNFLICWSRATQFRSRPV
jgi:hypothetical protein